jgi:hypothetical protein
MDPCLLWWYSYLYGVIGGPTSQTDLPTDYGNGASEINQENKKVSTYWKEQQLLHYTDQEQQMGYRDYN